MKKWIFDSGRHSASVDFSLLLLRVAAGGLMLLRHGYPKLLKLAGGPPYKFQDPIGLGDDASFFLTLFAELVCAFLIIIGFGTRVATIPLTFAMGVVTFLVHYNDGLGKMELPMIFFTIFFILILTGAGRYSVDRLIDRR